MSEFRLDLDNNAIFQEYLKDNYFIEGDINTANTVYIYFSSNALYYPNTLECFDTKIVKNNRYEWTRRCVTGNNIANIYVRDLFKQWCVVGINSNLNSLDKVADFLKSLVKHKKVITVGSSAGGYLATVFGILLDADVVFNFSGQFVLTEEVINEYSLLTKYKNDKTRSKYYSLLPLIEKSTVQIYYFYPAYNKADCIQKQYVENFTNVHCFGFNTSNHGVPIYPSNLTQLLTRSSTELYAMHDKYKGKIISQFRFSVETVGLLKSIYSKSRDIARGIYLSVNRLLVNEKSSLYCTFAKSHS